MFAKSQIFSFGLLSAFLLGLPVLAGFQEDVEKANKAFAKKAVKDLKGYRFPNNWDLIRFILRHDGKGTEKPDTKLNRLMVAQRLSVLRIAVGAMKPNPKYKDDKQSQEDRLERLTELEDLVSRAYRGEKLIGEKVRSLVSGSANALFDSFLFEKKDYAPLEQIEESDYDFDASKFFIENLAKTQLLDEPDLLTEILPKI